MSEALKKWDPTAFHNFWWNIFWGKFYESLKTYATNKSIILPAFIKKDYEIYRDVYCEPEKKPPGSITGLSVKITNVFTVTNIERHRLTA